MSYQIGNAVTWTYRFNGGHSVRTGIVKRITPTSVVITDDANGRDVSLYPDSIRLRQP